MRYVFEARDEISWCGNCPIENDKVCTISHNDIYVSYYNMTKPDNCPLQELNSCWKCPV